MRCIEIMPIQDLVTIMEKLLSPIGGCPWDLEQTPQTLAPFAIEEAHELAEALERKDIKGIKEELGDLLLQVVFHSTLAQKEKLFTFEEVIQGICTKLIRRHPHVFGDEKVANADEVLKNWDIIKKGEKKEQALGDFNIPLSLPALQRAQKIGDKTKNLKFDWSSAKEVFEKVEEEFKELKEAYKSGDPKHTSEELGDLFFVLAQLARHLKLEAETVARAGNRKFENRFKKLLELALKQGADFNKLKLVEKEKLWEQVKKSE